MKPTCTHSLLALLVCLVGATQIADAAKYLRADPDTTCQEAYIKTPTKEACLATEDYYGRPCNYCQQGGDLFCFNNDQARWAKIFGATCEHNTDKNDERMS